MTKKTLHKTILKTILQSKGRFFSILCLAMLGSFGLVGLKVTGPNINDTVQKVVTQTNMADFSIIGELGISQKDSNDLQQIQQATVEFGYFKDVVIQNTIKAIRVFSQLPTLSQPILVSGELPKTDNDIVLSQTLKSHYKIGDVISFDETGENHILKQTTFTISGFIQSSDYISNTTLGHANAGSGNLSSYAMIRPTAFNSDVYTISRIKYHDLAIYNTYSSDYDTMINQRKHQLEQLITRNSQERLDEVTSKATNDISQNKKSIDDAKQKLDEAKQQLTTGQKEIETNQKLLTQKEKDIVDNDNVLKQAKIQLEQSKQTLTQTKNELDSAKSQLDSGKTKLNQTKTSLDTAKQTFDETFNQLKDKEQLLNESNVTLKIAETQLNDYKTKLENNKTQYEQAKNLLHNNPDLAQKQGIDEDTLIAQKKALDELTQLFAQKESDYNNSMADYVDGSNQLKLGWQNYNTQLEKYEQGLQQYHQAREQFDKKLADYNDGVTNYQKGLTQYTQAYNRYKDGISQLNNGKQQLKDALNQLNHAINILNDNKVKFEKEQPEALQKITDGQQQIEDATAKVNALTLPKYTVYSRGTMLGSEGYTTIKATSDGISAVGNLFPVVLYAVAALVSLTTMTRFVSEERLNSGLLKALGYSKHDIYKKFIVYGVITSFIGSVIGVLAGTYLLPKLLGMTLLTNTILPQIQLHFYAVVSLLAIIIAIGCSVLPAYMVSRQTLNETTASLLLPKPPASGSSILLEKITFIWKKLSFTQKVTARNIFRYKQRMLMTIFGVAGSMALLFSGLGILSSLDGMSSRQFDHIIQYDTIISKNDYVSANEQRQIDSLLQSEHIKESTPIFTQSILQKMTGITNDQTITVLASSQLNKFINLYDKQTKQPVQLSSNGVAITEKLAKLLNINSGDEFTLSLSHNTQATFKVDAIIEMYAGHFVFMTPEVYENSTKTAQKSNGYLVKMANQSPEAVQTVASQFMPLDGIKAVSQNTAIIYQVKTLVASLTRIMLILIAVSILLAIVILYNLNTINVSERIRELSTIKVLGFLNKEVTLYIYKETILLSITGILFGLIGGRLLHRIIIETVATPQMMFNAHIPLWVYVVPCVIMLTLLIVIGYIINRQLKRVDMLEALKSVD